MKWLITGANGFIGRNLLRHLLSKNDEAVYFVLQRLAPEINHPRLRFVKGDLNGDFIPALRYVETDGILYLAQSDRFREFPQGASDMFNVNTQAPARLADWAASKGVQQFLYASTGSVYVPGSEKILESSPVVAGSYYAASKLAAEKLLTPYGAFFNVKLLRIFNPYGPDQKNMLIPGIIDRVRKGEPVILNGGKGMVFRPLYIIDLVEIISRLMQLNAEKGCEVFNLGGSETTDLGEVVSFIAAAAGVELNVIEPVGSQPLSLIAVSEKIYKLVNYVPVIHWKDGIKHCLQ